jgi:rhamnosyltransferase
MEVSENIKLMQRECGHLLIVDNGSEPETCSWLAKLPGAKLLLLGQNLGVAAALNRGAAWARANNFSWLVAFDQDSCPNEGFVSALWLTHLRQPEAAVVGPRILESDAATHPYRWVRRHPFWPVFFQRVECRGADLPAVTMVITSGSLLNLDAWSNAGGFDEGLFVDYVDVDYCLKIFRQDLAIAVSQGAGLRHYLGARQSGRVLGKDLRPTHHAPFRHYYIARNRVRLWARHAWFVPHWALFDLAFACFNGFRVLTLESEKIAKLKAMLLGTWDGLRGRSGPCPEYRRRAWQR